MDMEIGPRWQSFVDSLVEAGRYDSGSDVLVEGLRLIEEREAKLQALRDTLDASIERGGWRTDEQVGQRVRETIDRWKQARDG